MLVGDDYEDFDESGIVIVTKNFFLIATKFLRGLTSVSLV